jgi:hypothetical protein
VAIHPEGVARFAAVSVGKTDLDLVAQSPEVAHEAIFETTFPELAVTR